ncbi:MAG: LemA family protein [Firmicutes bacterium]|jgi:LemA protein|nr:LemA family protein [Bacillota bacterium]
MWVWLGLLGLLVYLVFQYNALVAAQQRVKNGWAQVDVQIKRRYDLVPNLVETVKSYASHEQETLQNVTDSRIKALRSKGLTNQLKAEEEFGNTLQSLFAVAENYPELKADANFRKLQEQLVDVEGKIAYARQFYNDTVQRYNIRTAVFPSNIIAKIYGFRPMPFYELDGGERENVIVDFSRKS